MFLPGDELVGRPALETTEGVWIDPPTSAVWPWLVQMGRTVAGSTATRRWRTSSGWTITMPTESIRSGRTWLEVTGCGSCRRAGRSLRRDRRCRLSRCRTAIHVLRMSPPERLFDAVSSSHLIPHWEDRRRLLIGTRIRLHHPGEVLATELARPGALMTRGSYWASNVAWSANCKPRRPPPLPAAIFTGSSRPNASIAGEFTVRLGTKGKAPARDAQRTDSYEVSLHCRNPGK